MKDPSVHGDQYVTVQVQVPRDLSPEAEQKLREFEAACRKSVKEMERRLRKFEETVKKNT